MVSCSRSLGMLYLIGPDFNFNYLICFIVDTTINSDTIHLSKCRPALSEDDTILEELSTKDLNNQDTLKPKKSNGGKHATILRNPSIRDREILCK